MAFDIARRRTNNTDWSLGAHAPETFWNSAKMEAKISELMSKPKGLFGFGAKPTREEAKKMLVDYMKANRIGTSSGDVGSVLLPAKEQKKIMDKIDDVRFDVRNAKNVIGAGVFALSGALAFIGISKIYKASKTGGGR